MSHIQNTINALQNQVDEAAKSIQVLKAIEGKQSFIVVTVDGGSVSATASSGLDLKSAISMLAAAARSYTESVKDPDVLDDAYKLIRTEVDSIKHRIVEITSETIEPVDADYEEEHIPAPLAPTRKRKPTPAEDI